MGNVKKKTDMRLKARQEAFDAIKDPSEKSSRTRPGSRNSHKSLSLGQRKKKY